ncbi:cytochrome c family protein [Erythrobacteraceae bacterium CFH 75059]|uniref:c-type cytochrome n=1 Tax=Qipengyuania thermophila TaxID=2509361 RepID=UPI00101F8337|nr:cytochrome c family protein [Qipengyuania thermophila]TCD06803.1 cytochrome c family protein [Erythrobacteraceae bacterium CFH 75059]
MNDRTNTIFGWILFSGIVALGLSILSGKFFHANNPPPPEQFGYAIQGLVEEGAAEDGPDLGTLLANADVAAGEKVYAKCVACHTINQGGANGIGPNLWAVLGTPVGQHAAGYAYSSALSGHGGTWTYENMDAWLANPRAFAPGTKMSFAGLSRPEDRANVIAFMHANGGGPPFPAPAAPAGGEAAAEAASAPDAGPGTVEGANPSPQEAVGGMGAAQQVPTAQGAPRNSGDTKPGGQ